MPPSPDPAVPDYLVIGAMKCGSSTVCAYLEDHPDTYMVPRCEPDFFCDPDRAARGRDWYAGLFADARPGQLRGEGSNNYAAGALFPGTPGRIHAHAPDVRLVYMVRHPLDRIVSAWVQNRVDQGRGVPASVDAAVTLMPDRYVDQSLYWRNLQAYRKLFPDERILVGFMEDLRDDPDAFWRRLTGFLGVAPRLPDRPHVNPSASKAVPGPLYSMLDAVPGSFALRRALLPAGLRRLVKERILSRPAAGVALAPATRARLAEVVGPDARALLRHCGKPEDFWAI